MVDGGPVNPTATAVLELARSRAPTLGPGRLVCVDGPAGSGKTTLGTALALLADDARVVHMDDLVEGWAGLLEVGAQLAGLLRPLAEGRAGSYRRYDWVEARLAETVTVPPVPMLVLEGVGAGTARFADLATVLVWVEAPYDVRLARGIERDGDAFAPYWEQWARDEALLFDREGTRGRADVVVDGTRTA